jgi:rod shape-determining protein MreC
METSRGDVGIAIRSAFLVKGTKQRFSLFALIIVSIVLIFVETIETKPLNSFRAIVKDTIYRGSLVVSLPSKSFGSSTNYIKEHINLYSNYNQLKKEYTELKNSASKSDFLELENSQLRKLIDEEVSSPSNYVSARVMIEKQSPYLNSFIINTGKNKKIKNGLAVLEAKNFIGRIVDVNYFSSRVLLVSDLNSKIPVVIEPSGYHAILSGHGANPPTLEYLPKNYKINNGDKVYTSGKARIFSPGIPVGEVKIEKGIIKVILFSDLNQITFVNIKSGSEEN